MNTYKAILSDFSRTILFPRSETYSGSLNKLYKEIKTDSGFDFYESYYLNEELLEYYKELKSKYKLYIFTTGYVQNDSAIKPRLDEVFESIYNLDDTEGIPKNNPNAYIKIANLIGINTDEMIFIDDEPLNIKAAQTSGVTALEYYTVEKLREEIELL